MNKKLKSPKAVIKKWRKAIQNDTLQDSDALIKQVMASLDDDLQTTFHHILNTHHFYNNQEVLAQAELLLQNRDVTEVSELRSLIISTDDRQWHYRAGDDYFQDFYVGSTGDLYDNGLEDLADALKELDNVLDEAEA